MGGDHYHLGGLGNRELAASLSALVRRGNELTAEVLAHLAEFDERRLHLELGFPSLFAYCVEALRLSEPAAGRRIAAARVCWRFPVAFERIASGELHLSALCALGPHLDLRNAEQLLEFCRHKSRRQIDVLLAARFPKRHIKDQIRRLPKGARAQPLAAARSASLASMTAQAPPRPARVTAQASPGASLTAQGNTGSSLTAQASTGSSLTAQASSGSSLTAQGNTGSSLTAQGNTRSGLAAQAPQASALASSNLAAIESEQLPAHRLNCVTRSRIEPLSANHYGIHFTADEELREMIDEARALASHQLPSGNLAELIKLALATLIRDRKRERFAQVRKPRSAVSGEVPRGTDPGLPPGDSSKGPGTSRPSARTSGAPDVVAEPARSEALPIHDPEKLTIGAPPGPGARPGPGAAMRRAPQRAQSRHIPAAVAREVYERDGGQCTFVSSDGRPCGGRHFLEFDHVRPFADGGQATLANLRLRCRAHNQHCARAYFGIDRIQAAIATARTHRARPSG